MAAAYEAMSSYLEQTWQNSGTDLPLKGASQPPHFDWFSMEQKYLETISRTAWLKLDTSFDFDRDSFDSLDLI